MRSLTIGLLLFMSLSFTACAQEVDPSLHYLAQTVPATRPAVFAPGLISLDNEYEFGSVFNKDATEFFYGVDTGGKSEIRYTKLVGDKWSKPVTILSDEAYGYNDPFLSPDEQRLYFISQKALTGAGAKKDYDIWYVEKQEDQWSAPINAGPNINSGKDEYYISFTAEGTMYFSSNKPTSTGEESSFEIYAAKSKDGEFLPATKLGAAINTPHYEADVFIAPDETYIIFCANRPDGLGRGDLYISFKNDDGTWTKSVNMGDTINTTGHELCPFVSMDGQYFFYTSNKDIYWVSTEVLEVLRGGKG